jgi:hypothetical protein
MVKSLNPLLPIGSSENLIPQGIQAIPKEQADIRIIVDYENALLAVHRQLANRGIIYTLAFRRLNKQVNMESLTTTMPLLSFLRVSGRPVIVSRTLIYYGVIGNDDNFPLHDGMKHAIIGIPTGRE